MSRLRSRLRVRWVLAASALALAFGAPAAAPVASQQAVQAEYVGSEGCRSCHRLEHARFAATPKGRLFLEAPRTERERLGCEGCHGPGSEHERVEGEEPVPGFVTFAAGPFEPPAETRNAVCLSCHEGSARMYWEGSQHESRQVACTDCHSIMTPKSETTHLREATVMQTCEGCHQRQVNAQRLSFARMPVHEDKMGCANCHNPHGSATERLLVASSVNETCTSCHAEKGGPFLWEHAPVAESCLTCHDPHGGRHEKLLNQPKPRLCQQCHLESRHPTDPQRLTATRIMSGRQCVNCHVAIHGSNHPSGYRFTR